jgi:hypothetical protein
MKPTEGSVKDRVDWGVTDCGIGDFSLNSELIAGLLYFALARTKFDIPNMPAKALRDFRTVRRSLFTKCFLAVYQKLRQETVTQEAGAVHTGNKGEKLEINRMQGREVRW